MPKITNWSSTSELSWKNDKNDAQLSVFNFDDGSGNSLWAFTVQQEEEISDKRPYSHADFSNRDDAVDAARKWMKNHPYGKENRKSYTEEERQHLVETIMAVRGEENQARPASDTVSEDRMQQFRRDLEELDDQNLADSWYQWVGEWLARSDDYYDEVDEQFQKTLNGEKDYGFVR